MVKHKLSVTEISGVGDRAEGNEFSEGEVFVGEAVEDDLGVESFELSYGGALLYEAVQGLVNWGLEFVGEIGVQRVRRKEGVFKAGSNGRMLAGEVHGGWAFGFEGRVYIYVTVF